MTVAGFVGADPAGLANLARLTDRRARFIFGVAHTVGRLLEGSDGRMAAEMARRMLPIAASLAEAAVALERRAAALTSAREVPTHSFGSLQWYVTGCPRWATCVTDNPMVWFGPPEESCSPPDLPDLLAMSPPQVATALSRLAPAVAGRLVDDHPTVLGSLDGAPPRLRYRANRILIRRHITRIETELHRLGEVAPAEWRDWMEPLWLVRTLPQLAAAAATADRLHRQLGVYRQWLAEDRQILLFDPDGDGRVVEVFGNVDRAQRIAVVVPGMANELMSFGSPDEGGLRANAAVLYAAATTADTDVATIAWLGYDTPDGIDAALRRAAETGAPALRRFVAGIDPHGDARVTVVAHSYGSLVAGMAAAAGLAADDLVFVGSPGTGLESAAEARLRPGGRVWVGLADGDPVAAAVHPSGLPPWSLPIPFPPPLLWHGTNPAADVFGARRFDTDGSEGHSGYFEAGSLRNLTRIVLGDSDDVELWE